MCHADKVAGSDRWRGLKPGERPYEAAAWFYGEYRYRPSLTFVRALAEHLGWSKADRVLDLGAGPAHISVQVASLVGEVTVMELSERCSMRDADAPLTRTSLTSVSSRGARTICPHCRRPPAASSRSRSRKRSTGCAIRTPFCVRSIRSLTLSVARWSFRLCQRSRLQPSGLARPCSLESGRRDPSALPRRRSGGSEPGWTSRPLPEHLASSAFSDVELFTHQYEMVAYPSIEAAIGYGYSLANVLARLGGRREAFEAEVRTALGDADTSPLTVRLVDSALIGRRPGLGLPISGLSSGFEKRERRDSNPRPPA